MDGSGYLSGPRIRVVVEVFGFSDLRVYGDSSI